MEADTTLSALGKITKTELTEEEKRNTVSVDAPNKIRI